jgi:hypothetical protein
MCCSCRGATPVSKFEEFILIISHKYKFIFIKTAKTAGTSIEVYLSRWCGESDVLTPIWPHIEPHRAKNYNRIWNPLPELIAKKGRGAKRTIKAVIQRKKFYNHIPARTVKKRIPLKVWNTYFKFCVERNPWDKTLSHYHMINDREGGRITFDQYIEKGAFCINWPKYCDSKGNVLVDKVIRYEWLIGELTHVFHQLAIPFEGSLGVRAKSEHRKDERPYQEVFNAAHREVIERAFAKEIELHGYVF